MAVVTFKDAKRTTQQVQQNQIFNGFSTIGREFKDPKLYDIELVKQDLLNHFNIRKGEKLENPNFGTNLWNYLTLNRDCFKVQVKCLPHLRQIIKYTLF